MTHSRIFLSIAAYRDQQLEATVVDCLAKAARPDDLRFGICWQHGSEENLLFFAGDPRFQILDVDWRESKGACWARAEIMKLWSGEDYFLQIDSHCRFAQDWDVTLIRMTRDTGSSKAILSTYATAFTPGPNEVLSGGPLQMILQAFTEEGIPQMRPGSLPADRNSKLPMRARFLAAGFLFTQGSFVAEVPYDPELYFMGEEAAMTLRAFTHGYDLFHPAETVIWHDYIRADASKHWVDHEAVNASDTAPGSSSMGLQVNSWRRHDQGSRLKVQHLLCGEETKPFGLGQQRTIQDYEAYAGLSFRKRVAQQYTLRGEEPPNPIAPADWTEHIYPWIARLKFPRQSLPEEALHDPSIWSISIFDRDRIEICRRDLFPEDLAPFIAAAGNIGATEDLAVICEFSSETPPLSWTLLPQSRSKGWLQKIDGILSEQDFAILKEEDSVVTSLSEEG